MKTPWSYTLSTLAAACAFGVMALECMFDLTGHQAQVDFYNVLRNDAPELMKAVIPLNIIALGTGLIAEANRKRNFKAFFALGSFIVVAVCFLTLDDGHWTDSASLGDMLKEDPSFATNTKLVSLLDKLKIVNLFILVDMPLVIFLTMSNSSFVMDDGYRAID